MLKKVVLAYSGGLDTSVAIKWINEKYGADVVTLTLDLGQKEGLEDIEKRALAIGAKKHYFIDAKDEFVESYVAQAIKANGLYEEKYPLSTALGRPLIAKKLVEIARKEGADGVAHGSTGKGNDQVRFDVTIKALAPELKIIAPIREWDLSRDEEIEYVKRYNLPVSVEKSKYSIDQNLWGRSIESGPLEDPMKEPEEDAFEWTVSPEKAPDSPAYVELEFEKGLPVKLNGNVMLLKDIIAELNRTAGAYGIGRIDHIEDRLVGIKSREVYECPAAMLILEAHKDLEKLTLTKPVLEFKRTVEQVWSSLVYNGLWMEPLREALDSFINTTQEVVEGSVRLKLYKGSFRIVGRSSPNSLYVHSYATYESISRFDQKAALGFIELWGLQTKLANLIRGGKKVE
jgi:argininosuccinate synthase